MNNFKEWFENNLIIDRYPMPTEIRKSDFDFVINVSDEFIYSTQLACLETQKSYFWFPLSEVTGNDMGLNSLYGALQILWYAEENNKKVLLHCHAGRNRSVSVADAYYYMRTGELRVTNTKIIYANGEVDPELPPNKLMYNIKINRFPSYTLDFIRECTTSFQRDIADKAGQIDKIKLRIGLEYNGKNGWKAKKPSEY